MKAFGSSLVCAMISLTAFAGGDLGPQLLNGEVFSRLPSDLPVFQGENFNWVVKGEKLCFPKPTFTIGTLVPGETVCLFKDGRISGIRVVIYDASKMEPLSKTQFGELITAVLNSLAKVYATQFEQYDRRTNPARLYCDIRGLRWTSFGSTASLEWGIAPGNPSYDVDLKTDFLHLDIFPTENALSHPRVSVQGKPWKEEIVDGRRIIYAPRKPAPGCSPEEMKAYIAIETAIAAEMHACGMQYRIPSYITHKGRCWLVDPEDIPPVGGGCDNPYQEPTMPATGMVNIPAGWHSTVDEFGRQCLQSNDPVNGSPVMIPVSRYGGGTPEEVAAGFGVTYTSTAYIDPKSPLFIGNKATRKIRLPPDPYDTGRRGRKGGRGKRGGYDEDW